MANEVISNSFGSIARVQPSGNGGGAAMAQVESNKAVATVLAVMRMAQEVGRNEPQAYENIMNACRRPGLAKKATYVYGRGGTTIKGPSIRLAEVIAQSWGRIRSGFAIIGETMESSEIMCFAIDMISLQMAERAITIRHERHTQEGVKRLFDPRDIAELRANMASRNVRECIRAITPPDIWEDALIECEKTLRANVDMSAPALKDLLDALASHGVSKAQIELRIQRKWDAIEPAQVMDLINISVSLDDGAGVPNDYFRVVEGEKPPTKAEELAGKLKKDPQKPAETTPAAPTAQTPPKATKPLTADEKALKAKRDEIMAMLTKMEPVERKKWQDDMQSRWNVRNPAKLSAAECDVFKQAIENERALLTALGEFTASFDQLNSDERAEVALYIEQQFGTEDLERLTFPQLVDAGRYAKDLFDRRDDTVVEGANEQEDTAVASEDEEEADADETEDPWAKEDEGGHAELATVMATDKCQECGTPVGAVWAKNCNDNKWPPLCAIHGKERKALETKG